MMDTKLQLVPKPQRPKLTAPTGISKSMAKALGCAEYFTGQYLQPERIAQSEHFLLRTGIEFHEYRQAYVTHLMDSNQETDEQWKTDYLASHTVSDDARVLIERDAFAINPDAVFGAELFLSVNRSFQPLEQAFHRAPGKLSEHPDFLASGTIDLLMLQGRTAYLRDPKSGFSTTNVSDDEPIIYAALVFAHFPAVDEVHWLWDFVRSATERATIYRRHEDLAWMQDRVRELDRLKDQHVARFNSGAPMEVNPFAGNCPYCQLRCPMRPRWEAGELDLGPPQTERDAVQLAKIRKVCEDILPRVNELLKTWMDQHPGPLELGGGYLAEAKAYETCEYPLVDALRTLGLDLVSTRDLSPEERETVARHRPVSSPAFDVPLASLTLGNLTNFAKAKKRAGLPEQLQPIAKRGAATRIKIHRPAGGADDQDLVPLLEASLATLQQP